MKRTGKIIKGVVFGLLLLLVVLVVGLIINNRIYYFQYHKKDTSKDQLTENEIQEVEEIYAYLEEHGDEIYKGFDGTTIDLIVFNKAYEFLFSSVEENEWDYIGYNDAISRSIYRRPSQKPQAFATKVGDRWVGSFHTHNYYNQSILEQVPFFYPPQAVKLDDIHYKAVVMHEMVHAWQGNQDDRRIRNDEHEHEVCAEYNSNSRFLSLLKQEASVLQEAMKEEDEAAVRTLVQKFLDLRDQRRTECKMSESDRTKEKEMEWLEGCARYAEYIASRGSKSMIAKGLDDIKQKASMKQDERYYALGMAQVIILKKILPDWQEPVMKDGMTLEDCLRGFIESKS